MEYMLSQMRQVKFINIKESSDMTKYLIYKENIEPFYIEQRLDGLTLPEKLNFCKKILSVLDAIKVEFWHCGSRYTVCFEILDTK